MAQALFTGHPIEEYLREEAGEVDSLVPFFPGIHPSFDSPGYPLPPWDLRFLAPAFSAISVTVREEQRVRKAADEFAERFKYILVSSTLLSTDFSASAIPPPPPHSSSSSPAGLSPRPDHPTSPHQTPIIPGNISQLPIPTSDNEEDNEVPLDLDEEHPLFTFDYLTWSQTLPPFPVLGLLLILVLRFPVILATISLLGLPLLPMSTYDNPVPRPEEAAYAETLDFLTQLIEASQSWNKAVNTGLSIVPTTPPATTVAHPLAHSVHTTLCETSSRVTTIRSLLSALARSPKELQMLEMMYGPRSPSPGPKSFEKEQQNPAPPSSFSSRALGSGFTTASGSSQLRTRRGSSYDSDRRRSVSYTAVTTPVRESRLRPMSLIGFQPSASNSSFSPTSYQSPVGLGLGPGNREPIIEKQTSLQRSSSAIAFRTTSSAIGPDPTEAESSSRRYSAMPAIEPSPNSSSRRYSAMPAIGNSSPSSPLTRYTPRSEQRNSRGHTRAKQSISPNMRNSMERDTFSPSALSSLRDHARGNIRHTASCLLALRFLSSSSGEASALLRPPRASLYRQISSESLDFSDDEEYEEEPSSGDPSYWEDVRSVLALFRAALEDATDRLEEAISQYQAAGSYLPSPPSSPPANFNRSIRIEIPNLVADSKTTDILSVLRRAQPESAMSSGSTSGFAPMASSISRFVRHIQAMDEALKEAQASLHETIDLISSGEFASSSLASASADVLPPSARQAGVMNVFDGVRQALGVALRECERGRSPLAEYLSPPSANCIPEEEYDAHRPETPALMDDDGRSDSVESGEILDSHTNANGGVIIEGDSMADETDPESLHGPSSIQSLLEEAFSMPRKEQVYEAETNERPFIRERPVLSREERIRAAKAKREAASSRSTGADRTSSGSSGMGPGTEVVQELKDAIWQVGERRKRLGFSAVPAPGLPVEPASPPL